MIDLPTAHSKFLLTSTLLAVGLLAACSGRAPVVINPDTSTSASSPAISPSSSPPPSTSPPSTPPTPPPPITVAVTPAAASITTQQTAQFTATIQNAGNSAIVWKVDGVLNGNASVGTISATGLYTPSSVAGVHSITAISVADATKSGSASVNVIVPLPPPAAITVTVIPNAASISNSQTQQFTAQVANSTNTAVAWQVDGVLGGNASVGMISTGGLYSPSSQSGTHSIRATSVADATKSGSASVKVTVPPPPAITVTVTPTAASIFNTKTQQFTAQVANSTNAAVTWQVDGVSGGNASVGKISIDGLYSPSSQNGTHTIAAISVADPTKSGSASVTVSDPPIVVSVAPTAAVISTIQSQQFTATVKNSSDTAVTWLVDQIPGGNADVGIISSTGMYAPPLVAASHSISAVSVADSTKRASVNISVTLLNGVLTAHNDNARTGQYLQESILKPANVGAQTFGRLFVLPVDGNVYAQPLYVSNVPVANKLHNVLFVATEHDSVYAFDADFGGAPLWQKSFIDPANGITTVPSADTNCGDIGPEIGITSTPVIDPVTGLLYVVAKTKEKGIAKYRLHKLDITTGIDQSGAGVEIQASVSGSAPPNDGAGHLVFTASLENQRLSLLLSNNVIYFGTGSYCDLGDHHGWMFSYDATSLTLQSAFNATPNGTEGGIWQSGGGAAADANGNVYVITGDGTFDPTAAGNNFGDTFLKFASGSFAITDYFTPFSQQTLAGVNADLGSSGVVLLPDQAVGPAHLLIGSGKQGIVYVLNRDNMGKFHAGSDSQIVQSFSGAACGPGSCAIFGTPAYFNDTVYTAAVNDGLRAYSLTAGKLFFSAMSTNIFKWPGATPSVSANGSNDGIVWTVESGSGATTILRALSAVNVSSELYNSNQFPTRDAPGPAIKFAVPTIANGKVFVGTQGQVAVFGLLN